jgi:hypothetical protein
MISKSPNYSDHLRSNLTFEMKCSAERIMVCQIFRRSAYSPTACRFYEYIPTETRWSVNAANSAFPDFSRTLARGFLRLILPFAPSPQYPSTRRTTHGSHSRGISLSRPLLHSPMRCRSWFRQDAAAPFPRGVTKPQATLAIAWGVAAKIFIDCSNYRHCTALFITVARYWPGALLRPGYATAFPHANPPMIVP